MGRGGGGLTDWRMVRLCVNYFVALFTSIKRETEAFTANLRTRV